MDLAKFQGSLLIKKLIKIINYISVTAMVTSKNQLAKLGEHLKQVDFSKPSFPLRCTKKVLTAHF